MNDEVPNPNPPPARTSGGLTPERIKVLTDCIVSGLTRKETAKVLGKSPRTVTRWKKDPRVVAEVERRRNSTILTRALAVLDDLQLHSADDRVRLQAAQAIARWAT